MEQAGLVNTHATSDFHTRGGTHHFECRQTDVRFRVSSDLPRYLRLFPLGENPGMRNRLLLGERISLTFKLGPRSAREQKRNIRLAKKGWIRSACPPSNCSRMQTQDSV